MPKTGNKNNNNNSVPTLAEYIAAQIANKRAAALDKSRNRTSVKVPMIPNTISEDVWRDRLTKNIESSEKFLSKAMAEGNTHSANFWKKDLDYLLKQEELGYPVMVEGANCMYNAGDCYGLNVPGNLTFAAKHRKLGFQKAPKGSMEPGDIVQDVSTGKPLHAMIYDSKDSEGNLLFNYARGHTGDYAFDINKNYRKQAKYTLPIKDYEVYKFVGTQADSTQWTNDYKRLYGNQMKCGGRRKAQLGLDIREGGIAIPIAPNMYYMNGRSHDEGGIEIGPNNKNGLEVEGGEVVKVGDKDIKVFSSVPLLRGVSPAQLVMGGANPNKVFKAQEDFKDRNRINDDGTTYKKGGMIYTVNGNVKNGLMSARPKAQLGKTVKINMDSYETVDEAVEKYKQLYLIRYGKEPSKSDINRVAWTKSLENAVNGNPNLITGYGPNVGVRGPNIAKIVSGANRGKQIARSQTAVRNRNIKSATPKRQAINTKVSEAARLERQSQFDAWQQGEAFKASTMPTDAVAVNRPTIGTGVRSGRRGRVDDVVAIERSQRGVDPLSSKPEFGVYDKAYAKKVNGKMNQFANALLASGTGGIVVGSMTYDDIVGDTIYNTEQSKEKQIDSNAKSEIDKSVNPNIKVKSNSSSATKVNNKNTNNDYISTTKPNTGESYIINPLTGEWIRNGVTETSEPSIKGTNKVSSRATSTPRRGETKPTSFRTTTKSTPTLQDTVNQITRDAIYRSNTPKIDLSKVNMPTFDVSQLGSKETKAAKAKLSTSSTGGQKEAPWIPQFNTISTGDWIGLGSNLAGHIASYFANNSLLKKAPMPAKPVMTQAAKLKTRYNINPELSETRETELVNRAASRRNSQSSNTSLAREQRIANEARNARNKLYGQKENIETQLINQDRLNRQSVMARNVAAYNDWLNKTYVAKSNQMLAKQQNLMSLISGIPAAVGNFLGNIDSRKATNNTIKAIAAANPNVDGRMFGIGDYYSQKLADGRVAIYDKNGKLKKYV